MRFVTKARLGKVSKVLLTLITLAGMFGFHASGANAEDSRTFPETGKTVSGRFLEYWDTHGGLAQQGFPISEEMSEVSETDGKVYTMQYFERAVFEKHPELEQPNDVLLQLLGVYAYMDRYNGNAPGQKANTSRPRMFPETGKTIGREFRKYWEENGGLAQQGYPISDEFQETSAVDGKTYTVQYFERSVFELHPENEVKLSLLGVSYYNKRHPGGAPSPGQTPGPAPTPEPSWLKSSGWTHVAAATNNIMVFYNTANGAAFTARVGDDGSLTELQHFPDPAKGNPFLTKGATHIITGPDDLLYFYKSSTGAEFTVRVRDDGSMGVGQPEQWTPNWSNIVVDPETRLAVFYNYQTGLWATNRANHDGSFDYLYAEGSAQPNGPRWSYITAVGNGIWLIIVKLSGIDQVWTVRFNEEGAIILLNYVEYPPSVWTRVVSDKSRLLFYNKDSGNALTASVAEDGTFTILRSFTGWNKWDEVVATNNKVVIFYNATTAAIVTDRLNDDGSYTDLKQYP